MAASSTPSHQGSHRCPCRRISKASHQRGGFGPASQVRELGLQETQTALWRVRPTSSLPSPQAPGPEHRSGERPRKHHRQPLPWSPTQHHPSSCVTRPSPSFLSGCSGMSSVPRLRFKASSSSQNCDREHRQDSRLGSNDFLPSRLHAPGSGN